MMGAIDSLEVEETHHELGTGLKSDPSKLVQVMSLRYNSLLLGIYLDGFRVNQSTFTIVLS
jgi:hypothetical protein